MLILALFLPPSSFAPSWTQLIALPAGVVEEACSEHWGCIHENSPGRKSHSVSWESGLKVFAVDLKGKWLLVLHGGEGSRTEWFVF